MADSPARSHQAVVMTPLFSLADHHLLPLPQSLRRLLDGGRGLRGEASA